MPNCVSTVDLSLFVARSPFVRIEPALHILQQPAVE